MAATPENTKNEEPVEQTRSPDTPASPCLPELPSIQSLPIPGGGGSSSSSNLHDYSSSRLLLLKRDQYSGPIKEAMQMKSYLGVRSVSSLALSLSYVDWTAFAPLPV